MNTPEKPVAEVSVADPAATTVTGEAIWERAGLDTVSWSF